MMSSFKFHSYQETIVIPFYTHLLNPIYLCTVNPIWMESFEIVHFHHIFQIQIFSKSPREIKNLQLVYNFKVPNRSTTKKIAGLTLTMIGIR